MTESPTHKLPADHRFLDEAGDTTFYGKGHRLCIGDQGVSLAFAIGMVKINADLNDTRRKVMELQREVVADEYLKTIHSLQKREEQGGFFFHAAEDAPEVRERFFRFIRSLDCSLEMIVARKIPSLFAKKHSNSETEFYADVLSHLLEDKFAADRRLVLNISERGNSTKNTVLELALTRATHRFLKSSDAPIRAQVVFNIQNHRSEPLLNVADYLCWAVQRVFQQGESRLYDFVRDRISLVVDLYDLSNADSGKNRYGRDHPLTERNKINPHLH